jgi:hypothetical protein
MTRKHYSKKSHKGGRRHKGKGFFDVLKKGFNFVKDNGLISKGLQGASAIAGALGKKGLSESLGNHAETAENFGVGRRHRKQKGQGFMDFLQPVMSLLGGRRGHHGKGLNMAGGHMYGNQEYPNSYHIHAHPKVHHARVHHGGSLRLAGEGVSHFGRINRGHSKMVIH